MKDLHGTWPHRYISSKAISRYSPIHGLGVFAVKDINKGEVVAVLGGIVVPSDEITAYWKNMGHVGIQISDEFFIVPSNKEELELQGVFNHSCDPNIGFRNQIELVTIRDIEPGEELCFDYGFNETLMEPFSCKCGSPNCRSTITGNDWKTPELQKKFGEYYSEYLKKKLP